MLNISEKATQWNTQNDVLEKDRETMTRMNGRRRSSSSDSEGWGGTDVMCGRGNKLLVIVRPKVTYCHIKVSVIICS